MPPDVLATPTRDRKSPLAVSNSAELQHTRDVLAGIVTDHGRDPANAWAVGHAILALGAEVELTNGQPAIDWLFATYAEVEAVGGQAGLAFPGRKGVVRVEPHADLLLKAFTEAGVDPDREVQVGGARHKVRELYQRSLCAAWVDGQQVSLASWNDTSWALQGLAQWSGPDLAWTADGGHAMTMRAFTRASVDMLRAETAFLREARRAGTIVQKQKQGIFAYTCGGAHMLQGAVWAVGRGFGEPADNARIAEEVGVYLWRMDQELGAVDKLIGEHPDYAIILLDQRLKYLGHLLETVHKAAAMDLFQPSAEESAALDRAAKELVATVVELERRKVPESLLTIRASNEQVYLDYIGDSAHAVRGLDLHTGAGTVRY